MNEQETIERVAIAIFMADATQANSFLTWANLANLTRDTYRHLAKAAIAEYRRVQEEQGSHETP